MSSNPHFSALDWGGGGGGGADHLTFTSASPLRNEPGFWISLSSLSSTQPFVSLLMWKIYEHLWRETFRKCAQLSPLLPHVRFSSALCQQQLFNPPLRGAVCGSGMSMFHSRRGQTNRQTSVYFFLRHRHPVSHHQSHPALWSFTGLWSLHRQSNSDSSKQHDKLRICAPRTTLC